MTSRDFCFWLQGYFELTTQVRDGLSPAQVAGIRKHLALVFKHEIDPSMGDEEHQAVLDAVHEGKPLCAPSVTDALNKVIEAQGGDRLPSGHFPGCEEHGCSATLCGKGMMHPSQFSQPIGDPTKKMRC